MRCAGSRIRAAWGPCRCRRCAARARGLFRRARFDGTGYGEPYRMHVHGRALRCRDCGSRLAGRLRTGRQRGRGSLPRVGTGPGHHAQRNRTARGEGLEAAARQARYDELCAAAHESGAIAVLLAHTMDDQAETVLIGLLRSRGVDALAGMPQVSHAVARLLRGHCLPLLEPKPPVSVKT